MPNEKRTQITATESSGDVSAIIEHPRGAQWLYVLAHGAGARHSLGGGWSLG